MPQRFFLCLLILSGEWRNRDGGKNHGDADGKWYADTSFVFSGQHHFPLTSCFSLIIIGLRLAFFIDKFSELGV
jgi:hypothetical protein